MDSSTEREKKLGSAWVSFGGVVTDGNTNDVKNDGTVVVMWVEAV